MAYEVLFEVRTKRGERVRYDHFIFEEKAKAQEEYTRLNDGAYRRLKANGYTVDLKLTEPEGTPEVTSEVHEVPMEVSAELVPEIRVEGAKEKVCTTQRKKRVRKSA